MVRRSAAVLDRPVAVPTFPMGVNANSSILLEVCPRRNYQHCFSRAMSARYPSYELFAFTSGPRRREDPSISAAQVAEGLFPSCAARDLRASTTMPAAVMPADDDGPGESFTSSALVVPEAERIHPPAANAEGVRKKLQAASRTAVRRDDTSGLLRCASPSRALDGRILLMLGLPTTAHDTHRRDAARTSWMRHAAFGRSVVGCFLLSAHAPTPQAEIDRERLIHEQGTHGDLVLLDAPETKWIITTATKYSNHTRSGRGMPTFKQYAFFQHVRRTPRISTALAPHRASLARAR